MRLETLTLERYGAFSDRTLTFRAGASVHVVVGANEAGKTSALSAIGDLLFGFGHTTTYAFSHEAKALRVGGVVRLADGTALAFRRRKGAKNTLVDARDDALPDDLLSPLIGTIGRETFGTEFGLTAQTLRAGGHELLKAGGRLAETLAASSAGLSALSRLREQLVLEADALFTPRKSAGKTFYLASARHEEAERRLRDAIVTADALSSADAAVGNAGIALSALNREHEQTGRDLARLQRALRTRPKLARLDAIGQDLLSFQDLPQVGESMVDAWRSAVSADAQMAAQFSELAQADAADAASIAALSVDEAVLSEGVTIDALRERIGAVRKAIEDLPRRREARRTAQDALDEAARRMGLPSHGVLLEALPTDHALARVRELIDQRRRDEERRREAEDRAERARREKARLAPAEGEITTVVDPESFRQRLDSMADVEADVDRLLRDRASCEAEDHALTETAAALFPRAGDPAALAILSLPDATTIAAHARAAEKLSDEISEVRNRRQSADQTVAAERAEIVRLSREGASVTRLDLLAARDDRDSAFRALSADLDREEAALRAGLATLETLSQSLDAVTDQLLSDSARAARRQAAEERLADGIAEGERLSEQVAILEARRVAEESAWRSLWDGTGVAPRQPADMALWREGVQRIVERRSHLATRMAEIGALAVRLESRRSALSDLLAEYGRSPPPGLAVDLLYREARARQAEMQKTWAEAVGNAVARARAEQDLAEGTAVLSRLDAALSDHALAWPGAMRAIAFPPESSVAEAEAALQVWQSVPREKQIFEREGRSIDGIERDLADFDRDVAAVCAAVAPDLIDEQAQKALEGLTVRLVAARRAADSRARLRQLATERDTRRSSLAARREAVAAVLNEAFATLGVSEQSDLAAALDRLGHRHRLDAERALVTRDLIDAADGLDEDAVRLEQVGLDPDLLPGEVERLTARQSQLLAEIRDAAIRQHQAEQEREALARGRDAGGAARERAEASAELLSIAQSWVVRAAAARLATRAIERHRAAVQDPLVSRAGALFSLATAGSFSGLGADYDESDRPILVALRVDGTRVPVAGLSEGSRDQLFLALRLALLEYRSAEPLPFIGDDLLASFDETRTARTLSVLAAFGDARQVILFTHHRHVADLAEATLGPAVDVINL
ncbi:AAA family ATPase [Microvirga antarctica]|uniref:AAA family ATPase n=1 Tax=Microvirga antarctica TaxID=2819233 RepID=UPI001B3148C9